MSGAAYRTYQQAIQNAQTDPEYLALEQCLRELEPKFRGIMQTLPEDGRDTVMEYIGTCAELHSRLLEIACFCNNRAKL